MRVVFSGEIRFTDEQKHEYWRLVATLSAFVIGRLQSTSLVYPVVVYTRRKSAVATLQTVFDCFFRSQYRIIGAKLNIFKSHRLLRNLFETSSVSELNVYLTIWEYVDFLKHPSFCEKFILLVYVRACIANSVCALTSKDIFPLIYTRNGLDPGVVEWFVGHTHKTYSSKQTPH